MAMEPKPKKEVKKIQEDALSHTAIPIEMFFKETEQSLAKGTAFIYEYEGKFYLITNWHNVTGINPLNGEQISTHGGRPDQLGIILRDKTKLPYIDWVGFKIDIYKEGKPDWYVHPQHKEKVDVVAIEVEAGDDFNGIFKPINKVDFQDFKVSVSDDIFILGFPYSIKGGGQFPIWKKGSVATEPDMDLEDLPKFYVDTASKSGMSGAPVIYRRSGIHGMEGGKMTPQGIIGTIQGFVGIYSGRILGESQLDAQLGIVWKAHVIEEIIKGGVKDEKSYL